MKESTVDTFVWIFIFLLFVASLAINVKALTAPRKDDREIKVGSATVTIRINNLEKTFVLNIDDMKGE